MFYKYACPWVFHYGSNGKILCIFKMKRKVPTLDEFLKKNNEIF